jgi:hypothetical protein
MANEPIEIVVTKTDPINDLASLMLQFYVAFKFDDPNTFFAKLGDIMTSNSTVDVGQLKANFMNLISSSTGILHNVGEITAAELNTNIIQPRISVVDLKDVQDQIYTNGKQIPSQSVDITTTPTPQYEVEKVNTFVGTGSFKRDADPRTIIQADNQNNLLNPTTVVTDTPAYNISGKEINAIVTPVEATEEIEVVTTVTPTPEETKKEKLTYVSADLGGNVDKDPKDIFAVNEANAIQVPVDLDPTKKTTPYTYSKGGAVGVVPKSIIDTAGDGSITIPSPVTDPGVRASFEKGSPQSVVPQQAGDNISSSIFDKTIKTPAYHKGDTVFVATSYVTTIKSESENVAADIKTKIIALATDIYNQATRNGSALRIDAFLYSVLPYFGAGFLGGIYDTSTSTYNTAKSIPEAFKEYKISDLVGTFSSLGSVVNKIGSLVSTGAGILSGINALSGMARYFTMDEIAWLVFADFYSILYGRRGIEIKDLANLSVPFTPSVSQATLTQTISVQNGKISAADKPRIDNPRDNILFLKDLVNGITNGTLGNNLTTAGINTLGLRMEERIRTIPAPRTASPSTDITFPTGSFLENEAATRIDYKTYDGTNFVDLPNDKTGAMTGTKAFNYKYGSDQIGTLYIFPVNSTETDFAPTSIPFEFNPLIVEGDVAARYASQQILSRIGDLFSFTGTSSMVVTLSAAYQALTRSKGDPYPLSKFSMDDIVAIENSYRSLVFPYFPNVTNQEADKGYKYVRPPYVKIIMGNSNTIDENYPTENKAYSNILRYPISIENSPIKKFRTYRTFVVTSVKITRNEEAPFLVEFVSNYGYVMKNFMGFTVDLSMTEVSPSYAEALPMFSDYYNKGYKG